MTNTFKAGIIDFKTGAWLRAATAEEISDARETQSGRGNLLGPIEIGDDFRLVYVAQCDCDANGVGV